jgi:hypothetical protein
VDENEADLRLAWLAYVNRVVGALEAAGHSIPPVEARGGGWRPAGGDMFRFGLLPAEPTLKVMDVLAAHRDSAEFRAVVEALRGHPVIRGRLDTLVGTAFTASRLEAEGVPDRVLWELDAGSASFTVEALDDAVQRVYRWLTRDRESYVVIASLPGVVLDEGGPIELEPGVEIDRMSDEEVNACLMFGLMPTLGSGDMVQVLSRSAIRIREDFDLFVGDELPATPGDLEAASRGWTTMIEEVVHAMRLFTDGTVSVRGAVSFAPGGRSYQGVPLAATSQILGGYSLSASEATGFRELWAAVRSDGTRRSKQLQVALRRFGFAGERVRSGDRLIDLMIAAEAVFAGETGETAHKLALRSAVLLGEGSSERTSAIFRHMKRAYDARSKLAHGGEVGSLKFADNTPASLDDYVGLVSGYMRDALKMFVKAAARSEPLQFACWDDVVLARLTEAGDRGT